MTTMPLLEEPHISNGKVESHTQQFRGTWASATLHKLVEEGKISTTAAWLAMTIDSLSKTDRGCYASNKYLGEKIHKSEPRVRALLSELEKHNILVCEWKGTERRLWIDQNCRSTCKRCEEYSNKVRPIENNRLRPIESDRLRPIENNRKVINSESDTKTEREDQRSSPQNGSLFKDFEDDKLKKKPKIPEDVMFMVECIEKAFIKKVGCKNLKWKRYIAGKKLIGLIDNFGVERVRKAINYYSFNDIHHKDGTKLTIGSIEKLEGCFIWIEDEMKRNGCSSPPPKTHVKRHVGESPLTKCRWCMKERTLECDGYWCDICSTHYPEKDKELHVHDDED